MPDFPHEIEAVLNAAIMLQDSKMFPDCCYQISEAMAHTLREVGFDAEAKAIACDVYGWNYDYVRFAGGMPIKAPKPSKHDSWQARAKARNQRGGNRNKPKTRPDLVPYYLGIFHEQVVDGDGYDGHVVCAAKGFVLDATALQFNRPHKGLHSSKTVVIPSVAFQPLPDSYQDLVCWPRNLADGTPHPDAGADLFAIKSLEQELIAISSPKLLRKQGQIAYCVRGDIDSDNWMEHGDQTQRNIDRAKMMMLKTTQQFLALDRDGDMSGTVSFEA